MISVPSSVAIARNSVPGTRIMNSSMVSTSSSLKRPAAEVAPISTKVMKTSTFTNFKKTVTISSRDQ